MGVSDARRLRALEDENAKLKRLLADTMPVGLGATFASPRLAWSNTGIPSVAKLKNAYPIASKDVFLMS